MRHLNPENFNVANDPFFLRIKSRIEQNICRRINISCLGEIDKFSRNEIECPDLDLRTDVHLACYIDANLRQMLSSLNIRYDYIQFPVNIRLLHPEQDDAYTLRDNNVDTIHCDHWSGSPIDSQNFFLYIRLCSRSPILKHYLIPSSQSHRLKSYRGSHIGAPKFAFQEIINQPFEGLLQSFPCTIPHKIARNGHNITISIDFRARNHSEIFQKDLKNKSIDAWILNKMTSLGVYWHWGEKQSETIHDRIMDELLQARRVSPEYARIRVEYLKKHYGHFYSL